MIVVAIIGILASIAIPKFAELIRKSQEGATKGNLGTLRSALSIYYGEMEGQYPVGGWNSNSNVLIVGLTPKYIAAIPTNRTPGWHAETTNVFSHWQIAPGDEHDGSGWIYDGFTPGDANIGNIWVACSHTDSKGSIWTSY